MLCDIKYMYIHTLTQSLILIIMTDAIHSPLPIPTRHTDLTIT